MAVIKTERVTYRQGETTLEGLVAYDDAVTELRPGILIIHDWNGLDDYEIGRAKQLAELGYVAFAVDIYGQGVRPKTPAECGAESSKYYQDNGLFRARLTAGLDALKARPQVDADRMVAIGYCFGGSGVVELARSGADLKGAVTFHGGVNAAPAGVTSRIRAKFLVLHAIGDPVVPVANYMAFLDELTRQKVDFQSVVYNVATHAFSVPGPMYDAATDRRSWTAFRSFLNEVVPVKAP